MFKIFFNSILI